MTTAADNGRLARRLAAAAISMIAFGFLLVPLYRVYCQVTGQNDTTIRRLAYGDAAREKVDTARWVTVELVATTSGTLPWEFRAESPRLQVHPGDLVLARFYARNIGARPIVGQAVPTITPGTAAAHFHKIECFCFARQPLAPGEAKEMPVQFQVDAALPSDVSTLTLAYTFFEAPADDAGARRPG
ncbi:MAG: cytochrome c oxidase assembly protein [Ignavibacteria bacterium]